MASLTLGWKVSNRLISSFNWFRRMVRHYTLKKKGCQMVQLNRPGKKLPKKVYFDYWQIPESCQSLWRFPKDGIYEL